MKLLPSLVRRSPVVMTASITRRVAVAGGRTLKQHRSYGGTSGQSKGGSHGGQVRRVSCLASILEDGGGDGSTGCSQLTISFISIQAPTDSNTGETGQTGPSVSFDLTLISCQLEKLIWRFSLADLPSHHPQSDNVANSGAAFNSDPDPKSGSKSVNQGVSFFLSFILVILTAVASYLRF